MKRRVAVTAALMLLGAVCGAILGSIALAVELARLPGETAPADRSKVAALGVVGGVLFGGVLTPIVAWLFLRRVPLGRAIFGTAAGVMIGVGVGAVAQPRLTILVGLTGFVVAAAALWCAGCLEG